jgi:hypothetical protein
MGFKKLPSPSPSDAHDVNVNATASIVIIKIINDILFIIFLLQMI